MPCTDAEAAGSELAGQTRRQRVVAYSSGSSGSLQHTAPGTRAATLAAYPAGAGAAWFGSVRLGWVGWVGGWLARWL